LLLKRQGGSEMTGAQILVDSLKKEGVDVIFGYPGGSVIPIFDALSHTKEINVILTRHEQGAAHAADGYARATGKVGVCIVTSGPGATNTITGIATAKMDSIPIIIISGQVQTKAIGFDAFQEVNMAGLAMPICKHNFLVKKIDELPLIIKEAFHIARSGRPGPVSIDLPVDITIASLRNYNYPKTTSLPGYKPTIKANPHQIKKLVEAINHAQRPLIYGGGGIIGSGASQEVLNLIEKTKIPIVITLMGLGSVPSDHRLFLGMPGMHGKPSANYAMNDCDLLIALGARFDDRVTCNLKTFAKRAKIAHVDIDPAEIGKNVKTDISVIGDLKNVITTMMPLLKPGKWNEWNRKTDALKKKYTLKYNQKQNEEILPQYVIDRISHLVDTDTIIATDVGQHQMWTALFFNHRKPRSLLTSGGLGTMGFGLPAAMGASIAYPERTVISISGDGSIQMNIQELATCAINKIPVKIAVLNNSYLGMVRQWQELFWKGNYAKTCLKQGPDCPKNCSGPRKNCPYVYRPNLVKVAEANGVKGLRTEKPSEVDSVLEEGLKTRGPVLMEFMVKPLENVYPMVPPGKSIDELILGKD